MMHKFLCNLAALQPNTAVYCTHEYALANLKFARAADPDHELLIKRISSEQGKRESAQPTLSSSVQLELDTNPLLWRAHAAQKKIAKSQLGHPAADTIEVFAAIKNWKDNS